ncbi:MAG TPA: hypothetical protein VIA18_02420, partial [Polyangia bacterium]|nr:hypothetical protein [Polyangia bacterium]
GFGGYVCGRRDVAEGLSAAIAPPPFSGTTYCQFSIPGAHGLPDAVAQYLRAYWSSLSHA